MVLLILSFCLVSFALAEPNPDRVEYQYIDLNSPVTEIKFCGAQDEVMLLLTTENSVYRSENKGFSWKPLSPILEKEGKKTGSTVGKVTQIIINPADKQVVVMLGSTGLNWFSEDCGKTIKALNYGRPMEEYHFHPTERDWGLAASWSKCSDFVDQPCKKYRAVYLTKDLGETWTKVVDYVVQFSWAYENLAKYIRKNIPKERIYVTRSLEEGDQKVAGWSYNVDMIKSDDFFLTSSILVPHGNKFLLADRYILVAQSIEEGSQDVQLQISNEKNIEKFYKADLPIKRISEHSYTLLDTSEGSIFLNVNHYGPGSRYGNIYESDVTGRKFAVSLLHNVRDAKGYCDFDKIYGLEGIYIANTYDREKTNEEFDASTTKKKKVIADLDQSYKKTVITFDKGGLWKPLTPPEKDSNGKRVLCKDEDCSLHLHSITSQKFGPAYSSENAVGIIIGVGNVGKYLSNKPDELNTYLSRDGGLTWTEIKKGSYIYEIGDHGAIIVMADDQKATDKVYFSWNEGLTWDSVKFTDTPIEIDNIIIEPKATSQNFIIYGQIGEKGASVAIDFSSLHEPQCKGADKPGEGSSDYELWSPNDGRAGNECLLGRKVEYVRRKRESECFNGEQFERGTFKYNCECTKADYECDLGFFSENEGPCKKIEGFIDEEKCQDGDLYYEVSRGYRKVAGDTCVYGVSEDLDPFTFECDTNAISTTGIIIILVLIAIIIALLYVRFSDFICKKWTEFKGLEVFDKAGYFSDLSKAPEGMEEELPSIVADTFDEESQFNSKS
ncbi:unnamed protein product [Blepharisma stoltei]|uniref:VPS10 domain-containing protein n=1 Tax=Blepharisma stoltei TaxID=1481888 RepID=A0AAU9IHJ1_9CILI|nr:unnamed protein product [Blepharisma stoltei]